MGDVKPDVNTVAADAPQHLHIKIKSQEGDQIEFKVKPTTKFEKIFNVYCEKKGFTLNTVRFLHDGKHVRPEHTVSQAEMEDGDCIDCLVHQVGGVTDHATSCCSPERPVSIVSEPVLCRKLSEELKPSKLVIENDSAKHAGHAALKAVGGGSGETHFNVTIVSQAFEGKGRIERHRIVYKVLGEELEGGVHSLSLKLLSPSELNFHEGFQN